MPVSRFLPLKNFSIITPNCFSSNNHISLFSLYQPCQRSQGSSLRLPLSGGINKKKPTEI